MEKKKSTKKIVKKQPQKRKKNIKRNTKSKIKLKTIKMIFIGLGVLIIIFFLWNFIYVEYSFSATPENAITNVTKDLVKIAEYSTRGQNANALQGITGYQNIIYFANSKSGASNQSNYYMTIKAYDMKKNSFVTLDSFKPTLQLNTNKTYKINDIATNTDEGRNYYLAYDATNGGSSKAIFSQAGGIREVSFNQKLTNLAYVSNYKKFYSVKGSKVYSFEMPDVNSSNKNKNLGTIELTSMCKVKIPSSASSQGITARGYVLFAIFQKKGEANVYDNYIYIYDLRNCKGGKTVSPTKTLSLGKCKAGSGMNNCELESMFFMDSKLYLGYNNSVFNKATFYRLPLPNDTMTINVSAKKTGDKVYLRTTGVSKKYPIYYYKICENKNGTGCNWKHLKDSNGKYLLPSKFTKNITINDTNKDWYLTILDIFGNKTETLITKEEIAKQIR